MAVSYMKLIFLSRMQALYCDVRQFVNYVYENDGNTFRKVALSALLDSVCESC